MSVVTTARNMVSVPFVDLRAQYALLSGDIEETILRSLRSTDYILGDEVEFFEQEFAAYCGTDFAVGVDSGFSALELALRAYGIGPGDEVITVANTFVATAFAISSTGATPILVDIAPDTFNLDVNQLEGVITTKTKAIIPVHLYGHPGEMDCVMDVAGKHGLVVIEDACQAHGARYRQQRAGSIGHAAAFSFYPAKNLGACGDGGMVVTNDPRVAKEIRMLRNYGQREKYLHSVQGYNRRLDTLQASVLRVKLRHLDDWNSERRNHAELYGRLLGGSAVEIPSTSHLTEPVWHLYVVRSTFRAKLQAWLGEHNISTGIHYPVPVHLQPAYRSLGYHRGDFPVSEQYSEEILSLPMYAELSPALIERVAEVIVEFEPGKTRTASRLQEENDIVERAPVLRPGTDFDKKSA